MRDNYIFLFGLTEYSVFGKDHLQKMHSYKERRTYLHTYIHLAKYRSILGAYNIILANPSDAVYGEFS